MNTINETNSIETHLKTEPESNMLKINKDGFIHIPPIEGYFYKDGPFTVMGYITPKKSLSGNTELTIGTIFSSKPNPGRFDDGGWQLFLEVENNEEYYLCFKVDDGFGYHVLRAPLNNLYGTKLRIKDKDKSDRDNALSKTLFKEYTHFVAAVKESSGDLSIYVNGYLLAKATPLDRVNMFKGAISFQLKGIYKEAIDKPTHFFTLKKEKSSFSVGYGNWDSDEFIQLGDSFELENNFKEIKVPEEDRSKCGISAIRVQKGMMPLDEIVMSVIPLPIKDENMDDQDGTESKGKILLRFFANKSVIGSLNTQFGMRIGSTEEYIETEPFEGFVKHISLWKKALSQQEIISYMDHDLIESDHFDCIGFWKLESDLEDSSPLKNRGVKIRNTEFVNLPHVLPVYMEEQIEDQWCWSATALAIVEFYDPLSKLTQKNIVDNQVNKNPDHFNQISNKWWYVSKFLDEETKHIRNAYIRGGKKMKDTLNRPELLEEEKKKLNDEIVEFQKNKNTEEEKKALERLEIIEKEKKESEKILSEFQDNSGKEIVSFDFIKDEINNFSPLIARVGWYIKNTDGGYNENGGHFMCITGVKDDNIVIVNDPWYGITEIEFKRFLNSYQSNGYLTDVFTTCVNNSNFITRGIDLKLRTDGYQLDYNKEDGNFIIQKITKENEKETITEIASTGSNFYIEKMEFAKDGTTVIYKKDGSKLEIKKTKDVENPRPPFTLDLKVDGKNWDVEVVEVFPRNDDQNSSDNLPGNTRKVLYSIKEELFGIKPIS